MTVLLTIGGSIDDGVTITDSYPMIFGDDVLNFFALPGGNHAPEDLAPYTMKYISGGNKR